MSNDESRDDDAHKVERNHPQTRKGESDARGSARWNDDVEPRDGDDRERGAAEGRDRSDEGSDSQLSADEVEAVRRDSGRSIGDSVGGGGGPGSGTPSDTGDLGGGGQAVPGTTGGTASPGGDNRR